jgi:hypothetical protein
VPASCSFPASQHKDPAGFHDGRDTIRFSQQA